MMSIARKGSQRGFSLIEMLVVVGVILILAGTIYPALLKAKEWGRSTKCLSNLKQLQIATLNYATDSGHLPYAWDSWSLEITGWYHTRGWVAWDNTWGSYPGDGPFASRGADGRYNWRTQQGMQCITNGTLWAYVQKEASVYLCPTFAQRLVCGQTDAVRSYSMNETLNHRLFGDQSMQASRTVLYGDDARLLPANGELDARFVTNQVATWHGGRGHVIYVDGHTDRW
jgi:prepilin-type N-terminal cleavage/methylation domain-containing protein/prepilin-type processing-associated H-X9-DG protein